MAKQNLYNDIGDIGLNTSGWGESGDEFLDEWRGALADVEEERAALGALPRGAGMAVEGASAAILADAFLREAGFATIGTNDLTQFTLAMDRGHPRLSPRADALDPAVLHLVARTAAAGRN